MKLLRSLYVLLLYFMLSESAFAQPGFIDNTFGLNGSVTKYIDSNYGTQDIICLPNDTLLALSKNHLLRYLPDGQPDASFGVAGVAVIPLPFSDVLYGMEHLADGKILLYGTAWGGAVTTRDFLVVRCLPSGELDSSFGSNGIVVTDIDSLHEMAYSLAVLSDGSFLITGQGLRTFITLEGDFVAIKYLPDGTLDATFGNGGKKRIKNPLESAITWKVAVLPSGRILLGGSAESSTSKDIRIMGLQPNGAIDSNFGSNGYIDIDVNNQNENLAQLLVDQMGHIYCLGTTTDAAEHSTILLFRSDSSGVIDFNFGGGIQQLSYNNYSVAGCDMLLDKNGDVIALSNIQANIFSHLVMKIDSSGQIIQNFGGSGYVTNSDSLTGTCLSLQSNNKIIVGASTKLNILPQEAVMLRYQNSWVQTVSNKMISRLAIYPNPTNSTVRLELPEHKGVATVSVVNALGQLVVRSIKDFSTGSSILDVSKFPDGYYSIYCETANVNYAGKLLVSQYNKN